MPSIDTPPPRHPDPAAGKTRKQKLKVRATGYRLRPPPAKQNVVLLVDPEWVTLAIVGGRSGLGYSGGPYAMLSLSREEAARLGNALLTIKAQAKKGRKS